MLTDRELQTLRNLGNESEDAANEIDDLRAMVEELKAECQSLRDSNAWHRARVAELEELVSRYRSERDHYRNLALNPKP